MRLLFLPGMDGSGTLWGPLLDALGDAASGAVLARYATNVGRYDELLDAIAPTREPTLVVAESFGGPLAIQLAARDANVSGLVLIASFARGPRRARWAGAFAGLAPHPPPRFALRALMLGGHPVETVERALVDAIAAVEPAAMRARIREVGRVDVRRELSALRIPIVWIDAARDRLLGAPQRARGSGRVITIDGPHLLAQVRPHRVAAVVVEHSTACNAPT
jgi:pimeloyl-ACP methyl ester carboxylesterase